MPDKSIDQSGSRNIGVGGDVIGDLHTGDVIYQAPPPAFSPLHQLLAPTADFTGRAAELAELRQHCQQGLTISGVQGMGGVGKTALALKLADELKPAYPDAQFYLDLQGVSEQPLSPAQAMAHIIRAYHPENKLPDDENALGALYRSVLDQQKALLLLDNAKDAAQVAPLAPPPGCLLLVTSRQHFGLPGFHPIHLDALTPADARALLLKIEPRIGEAADELAELCGRLPLALELAAHALKNRPDITPAEYGRRLRDAESRLDVLDKTDFPRKVKAAISSSYDLLNTAQQKLWAALAVFPGSFDHLAAAAVWEMATDEAQDRLGELMNYSLVEFSSQENRYRLHDLARVFADEQMSEDERDAAGRRHAEHFCLIIEQAQAINLQGGEAFTRGMALYDLECANIEAGQAWAVSRSANDERAIELCIRYPLVGWAVLNLRLHPREQIRWLEITLAAARKLNCRKYEAAALGNLGIAYKNLGEIRKAIECYEQCLLIHRKLGDRKGEGGDLGNLGNAYKKLGEMRKAIEFHNQDLAIARELGNRQSEGAALGNLGIAYKNLGEIEKSIECHQQRLAIARELGDRRGEGNALGNLGISHFHSGEIHKASKFHEQQLAITREIGDHRGEGGALWSLGRVLNKLGDREQSVAHAEAALKIFEEIEDPLAEEVRKQLAEWRKE